MSEILWGDHGKTRVLSQIYIYILLRFLNWCRMARMAFMGKSVTLGNPEGRIT